MEIQREDNASASPVKAPSAPTDPGTAGKVAYDANYIYVCVATNTWKRAKRTNLSSW